MFRGSKNRVVQNGVKHVLVRYLLVQLGIEVVDRCKFRIFGIKRHGLSPKHDHEFCSCIEFF